MKKLFTYMFLISGFAAALLSCAKQEFEQTPNGNALTIKAELISSPVWTTRAADNRVEYGSSAEIGDGEYIITAQKEDWNTRSEQASGQAAGQAAPADAPLTRGTPITSVSGIQPMRVNVYNTKTSDWNISSSRTATIKATYSGGAFTTSPAYNWPTDPNSKTSLFTYSPEPSGTNGLSESSSSPHQITYTVPSTVGNQPDFCTAVPDRNIINDDGNKHVRNIALQHRLTAVGFSILGWNLTISQITVSGVSMSGTFDMNNSTWGSLGSTGSRDAGVDITYYEHSHNSAYANITKSNGYLMMIPQTLTDAATVTITFKGISGTTATGGTITAKLKDLGVTWGAGDKVTYNIRLKTAPAVTSGDLTITTYKAGYTTSNAMTMVMDNKDNLTFTWNESWLKIHRGSPKNGDTSGGYSSGWTTGTDGPWNNIYFFATEDNPSTITARKVLVTVSGTRSGTKSFNVWQAAKPAANPINPPSSSDYVKINGLYWTKGNLVATSSTASGSNGCRVGAPTDYGLYFQFGSLIGWTGGSNGTGTGSGQPGLNRQVWPAAMSTTPTGWPNNNGSRAGDRNTVVDQYFFNYNVAPYSNASQDIRGFNAAFTGDAGSGNLGTGRYAAWGIGDPCTYYLGNKWRLPTSAEYLSLDAAGRGGWTTNGGITGRWFGTSPGTATTSVFFPASGYRNYSSGSFSTVTAYGYGWSSSVYDAKYGNHSYFYSSGVFPRNGDNRSSGLPVRCVSEIERNPVNTPTANDYVKIGTVYWAKGNLVATSSTASGMNGCKVGAPTDYGLYFQFGSLIGWTGGSNGTGAGQGQPALSKQVWPTAMSKTPTGWPSNYGLSAGDRNTVVDQYFFNYNVAPYSNQNQDIRGFNAAFTGDAGSGTLGTGRYAVWGIGDPCTYYLGDKWRLPTTAEYLALNNAGSGGWTTNGGVNGRWLGTSPGMATTSVFFPASGHRYHSNGSFGYVTAYGYSWSSSVVNAMYGYYLSFYSSSINPQNSYLRSFGFPIRCVSTAP